MDQNNDGDEEEGNDIVFVSRENHGSRRNRLQQRSSVVIMKGVLGDSTHKKEEKSPSERRWKWFDLIMGLLWWVGSMFFLYMTIVNIGGTY